MDHAKKLQFIENMTAHALNHMKSAPNVPTPSGGMSHDKILSFLAQQTKQGLQHFADGGTALSGPSSAGNVSAPQGPQGIMGAISNILGTNNNFQASSADIQKGTNAAQLNNAYNGVQGALGQQQNALAQQEGLTSTLTGQANQGANTQNNLTDLLTQRANGAGPNPAQAQLNQNTGQNIQQQAALMAGQRGAGANAGLIARQNAQQGAATQQNSVGQAATMNANQQIAAQNQLQNLASTQVGQGQGGVSALTGASNAFTGAQQGEQGILQNANTAANNAAVTMQSNINNVNSGVATGNQAQNNTILNDVGKGISSAASFIGGPGGSKYKGGEVKLADGGFVSQYFSEPSKKMASGGAVKRIAAEVSPGEVYLSPGQVKEVLKGANPMKIGHHVPGKAKVKNDSLKNDTVPADLEEGGVVIPRHITTHKMAPEKAAAFVHRAAGKKRLH